MPITAPIGSDLPSIVIPLIKLELQSRLSRVPAGGSSWHCAEIIDYIPFAIAQSIPVCACTRFEESVFTNI